MCHKSVSDYKLSPKDCSELSLINDPESDAILLYYPSPTSTEVSIGDDGVG